MFDRDKYPVFPQLTYDIDIPIDSVFPLIAHRFDAHLLNGTLRYRFFPDGTAPQGLHIHPDTVFPKSSAVTYSINPPSPLSILENGTLVVNSPVDLETLPVDSVGNLHFVVTATLGGTQAVTKLQLKVKDLNEFAPQFERKLYEASIPEDATAGSVIVRVQATDADKSEGTHLLYKIVGGSKDATFEVVATDKDSGRNGELEFQIIKGDPYHRFLIEKASAKSALLKLTGPLDHESRATYELTVEARDGGVPSRSSTAVVTVNVINRNDNPPIFQKMNYEQEVSSDLPIGYPIVTVAVNDADHDRLSFSLSGDPACSSLAVDPLGVVSFAKAVSKRTAGKITCIVSATDGVHTANATLRLNVFQSEQPTIETPQKNHAPRFSSEVYTVRIDPANGGQVLKKVKATDPDGDIISYSIEPPEFRNLFAVDAEGQVTARVPLHELKQSVYSFLVVAEDNGHPVMSSFTNIRVKVPENDNHVVTANSLEGTASTFTAPPSTIGSTTDKHSSAPPTDSTTEADTTTYAGDTSDLTSLSTIEKEEVTTTASTSEVTESAISFSRKKYTYAIRTGATVGTYLGHIEVNNGEGVKLVFRKNKQFVIDEQGWIHSAVPLSAPEKIEDDILAIKEGRTVATVPFMVHILPPDSASTLVPTSPEAERSTTADPTPTKTSDATAATQSVSTVGETASTASATFSTLTIETSASSDPSTAPTTGSTSDFTPSEQQPSLPTDASTTSSQFSFARSMYFAFVPEGQYTNGIRLAIKPEPLSVNRQTAVRYEIDDASQNIPFFITADGQLIIFDVDRESQASYMFTIKASSPEFGVAKATMNVTILDTNDNYPVFDASPSVIGLYRDAAVGTPLYHFSAHDQDADNYGAVTYGLEEHGSPFDINSNDGTLTVAHALDSTPEYSVTVFARDNGRPSLKSTQKNENVQITIQVFDPTVESPHFQKELPEKVVFFGTQPRSEIGTILAGPTITTKPNQDKILYGLVDDNSGLFAIEDGGRLVLARRPMDNEKNRYIQLNITAENSHGKDWTLLNVFVEGESTSTAPTSTTIDGEGNNSACYFPTKVYSTEFMENVRGRKRLLKVTSSCESEGRPYEYSFAYPSSEFELDAKTGEVFVKIPLDREQRSYHFLYINVSSPASTRARRVVRENPIIEQAKSSLTPTQTLVVVRVLDENDNAPAFLHGAEDDDTLVAAVDWQARLFTPVIRLEAKDADERPTLTYSISGTGSDYFLVNATSGLVILAKSIADYSGDSFQLTATVTDGLHIVPTPLRIYVISPSSSLVQLTAEVPHSEIDQRVVERTLNELNGLDNHLLAKQPFVDHQGHADPTRLPYTLTKHDQYPLFVIKFWRSVLSGRTCSCTLSTQKQGYHT
ncbi:cadherin domain protein [Ancylostoma ceylanicum]|uniref:Cadherin domain protein n=1 Tax=Ancylostoma ceylanicum TaxID=53326 RepID=A0A0D6LKY7_9BILA|nr:cadherin domain protein [Ancylostoma ceylanicum]